MPTDIAEAVRDFERGTDVPVETSQSLIDYLEANSTPDAIYAVLIREAAAPLEEERKQLLRMDEHGVRIFEWGMVEGRRQLEERFLTELRGTEMIVERRTDQNTDRIMEPHELRFEGPATAFGLRGTVRLGWLDEEDRNALVERLTQLMA
jgi:hypothetical protein